MKINQSFAASGRGYVRAVYSKRARGFAVPVDLLRVHCRTLVRVGVRGRVRDAFAGYLVTDDECGPFSESRKNYAGRPYWVMRTGCALPSNFGGDLDAPEWIAAGAMFWCDGVGPFQVARARGAA